MMNKHKVSSAFQSSFLPRRNRFELPSFCVLSVVTIVFLRSSIPSYSVYLAFIAKKRPVCCSFGTGEVFMGFFEGIFSQTGRYFSCLSFNQQRHFLWDKPLSDGSDGCPSQLRNPEMKSEITRASQDQDCIPFATPKPIGFLPLR